MAEVGLPVVLYNIPGNYSPKVPVAIHRLNVVRREVWGKHDPSDHHQVV